MPHLVTMLPGVVRETLAAGPTLMVVRFTFAAGARVPPHKHESEQSTYVLHGRLRYSVGDRTLVLAEGESIVVPGNVEHGAEALEPSAAVDSFTPVRSDYLDRE